MIRYLILTGILTCALSAGACAAEEQKELSATEKTAVQQDSGFLGLNFFKPSQSRPLRDKEGDGIDRMGTMDPGQTYDEQTGMPNVVPSDDANEVW